MNHEVRSRLVSLEEENKELKRRVSELEDRVSELEEREEA